MATNHVAIAQEDFGSGAWHDIADYLIPENGLKELHDGYLEEDGAAIERNATVAKSNAAIGSSGRWLWDGYFDAGWRTVYATPDDFGVLAADDETPVNLGSDGLTQPKPSALVAGMLFIGGGYIYAGSRQTAPYSTGTITATEGSKTVTGSGTTWNTLVDAGMLLQVGNERVYVVASVDSTTQITLADEYEGTTGAGKAYILSQLYKITGSDPYPDAEFYAVCVDRLVWAERNLVHASERLAPHDLTATIGAEEVPTTHELPEGVRVTGLATVGQTLFAFTTHGVWTIEGFAFDIVSPEGTLQHRVQRHSGEHILWDGNGIASWQQMLIVPCADGIFLMDGVSEPLRISHPLDEDVMAYVDRGYKLGKAAVIRGHYLLPVYSGVSTMRDMMVCRVNRPQRIGGQTVHPWSHFDRHARQLVALAVRVGEATREPTLLGVSIGADALLVECPYFDPAFVPVTDANGEVPTLDLISRAYPTGNNTKNMVRNVRTRYELVGDGAELQLSYSLGGEVSGLPLWNQVNWDEFDWSETEETASFQEACAGGESNGRTPKRCRVNEATRFFLWRVRNPDPSASCRIRGIDIRVRPSQAVRR